MKNYASHILGEINLGNQKGMTQTSGINKNRNGLQPNIIVRKLKLRAEPQIHRVKDQKETS